MLGAVPEGAPLAVCPADVTTMDFAQALEYLHRACQSGCEPIAAACCFRLAVLAQRVGMDRVAAEAGALQALVDALRTFRTSLIVTTGGVEALAMLCLGDDGEAEGLRARALGAGALSTVVAAMTQHADGDEGVLQRGVMALSLLVGADEFSDDLRQQALAFGAHSAWLGLCPDVAPPADVPGLDRLSVGR